MATKVCEMCGTTKGVKRVTDPYDLEINGRVTKMNLCVKCEQDRRDEI